MACYVGITTDLQRRKKEHEREYQNIRNWQTIGGGYTREQAQALEDKEASEHGCNSSGGGREPVEDTSIDWYVYHFEYDLRKISRRTIAPGV